MSNTGKTYHRWLRFNPFVSGGKRDNDRGAFHFCVQCGMIKQNVVVDKRMGYTRADYWRGDFFQSARAPIASPPCPLVFLPPTINGFTIHRNRTEENHARFGTISATIPAHAFTEDGYEKAT